MRTRLELAVTKYLASWDWPTRDPLLPELPPLARAAYRDLAAALEDPKRNAPIAEPK